MREFIVALIAVGLLAVPAVAQQAPATKADIAEPGGKLPGDPKIALVKVADGFKENMRIVFDDFLPKWNYCAVPLLQSNGQVI